MNFDYMAHLGDTAYLQKQINENDEIIIPRENPLTGDARWLIRRRLVLDSGKTVILDGAHLRLDDGIYEQIFATEPEMGMDQAPKKNIKIIGKLIDDYFTGDLWHDGSFIALLLLLFMFLMTWLTGGFDEEETTATRGTSLW